MKKILGLISLILIMCFLSSCELLDLLISENDSINEGPSKIEEPTKSDVNSVNVSNRAKESEGYSLYEGYFKSGKMNESYYTISESGSYDWYYLPSTGTAKFLIIPVELKSLNESIYFQFSSSTLSDINLLFNGDSNQYWKSVKQYYYESSYGNLTLEGTLVNEPIVATFSTKGIGRDQCLTLDVESQVINQTQSHLEKLGIDTTEYDSDGDGFIDLVWYVYSCKNAYNERRYSLDEDVFWAYTFVSDLDSSSECPVVNNYCWASYSFMYEGMLSGSGRPDAHTFIHETGHALGLDDYYISSTYCDDGDPVGYIDMMSGNIGDHNAYSKMSLGWISPYVVTGECEITINSFEESGDCIIVPNYYDGNAFSEYILIELYSPTGLNYKDLQNYTNGYSCMSNVGVKIYYVDARLYSYNSSKDEYKWLASTLDFDDKSCDFYGVGASNTPEYSLFYYGDDYGEYTIQRTEAFYKLIEAIDRTLISHVNYDYALTNRSLFTEGYSLDTSLLTFHNLNINYKISVSSISKTGNGYSATVKFEI